MVIREMKSELSGDWFDFFDNRAFADHEDWKGCYCTGFFQPRPKEYEEAGKKRKDYAKWLVAHGIMRGYLAYDFGKVVGWCNVNDKGSFPRLNDILTNEERIIAIACFIIQKDYRGRGIAQKLLDRIVEDAKKKGRKIIEAYPRKKATTEFGNYHGPYSMYEKNGFTAERIGDVEVLRRYL